MVGQELLEAIYEIVVAVNEHAGDPVDDRIGQATGRAVADGGYTVLCGLDDGKSPALLG